MAKKTSLISLSRIERSILWIRDQSVILDEDLAELYEAETRILVQAVTRHKARFPADFMFRLTKAEFDDLQSQVPKAGGRGGRRYTPYAFTEHGVAMLSSVLNSQRAVAVNIEIIRAFVKFRRMLAVHQDLALKVAQLERQYDKKFRVVFDALRALMLSEERPRRQIGFRSRN